MTRKKLYRQFKKKIVKPSCATKKKTMAAKQKRRNYDEKKKNSQTNKNYFCTYPKNGKYKFEKKL